MREALALMFLRKIPSAFLREAWAPRLQALGKASLVQEAGIAGLPALGSPLHARLLQIKAALTGACFQEQGS